MSRQKPNGTYWKKRVLSVHPEAQCQGYAGRTFISFHIKDGDKTLGIGDTVRGAWRSAASFIRSIDRTAKP